MKKDDEDPNGSLTFMSHSNNSAAIGESPNSHQVVAMHVGVLFYARPFSDGIPNPLAIRHI